MESLRTNLGAQTPNRLPAQWKKGVVFIGFGNRPRSPMFPRRSTQPAGRPTSAQVSRSQNLVACVDRVESDQLRGSRGIPSWKVNSPARTLLPSGGVSAGIRSFSM
jgi:hypothetical protein